MLQSTPRSKVHCLLFTFNPLSLQLLTGASLRALFHLFSVTFSAALLITTTAFKCSRLTNGRSSSCCQIQVLALVSRVASYLKKFEGVSENTFNTNTQACQHDVTQLWLWAQEHLPTLKTSWEEDHSDELCLKVKQLISYGGWIEGLVNYAKLLQSRQIVIYLHKLLPTITAKIISNILNLMKESRLGMIVIVV